jgi:hypothetical protein
MARFEELERGWKGDPDELERTRNSLVEGILSFQLATSMVVDRAGKYVPLAIGRPRG